MLTCVVLAGGLGTRMRPLTDRVPKSLIPVLGRPFAEIQLEWLARQGVRRVIYCIGYLGEMVKAALGDGARFHTHIDYVYESDRLLGSAGALRLAYDVGMLPQEFFVLYGDSYLTVDLKAVELQWRRSGLPALMTVLRNAGRWDKSNATLKNGRVIYDKRRDATHGDSMAWIDYGISILSRDLVADSLGRGTYADLADLMHVLSKAGQVAGLEVRERFYEVGSPEGLRDLEAHLRSSP